MGVDQRRQAGRPSVSANEAARILRLDRRTVLRRMQRGDLDGAVEVGANQQRWYVYSDQLGDPAVATQADTGTPEPVPSPAELQDALHALQAENLDLRVQLAAAHETTQLVMAAQANVEDAARHYRNAAEGIRQAAEGFKSSADSLFDALEKYRDAVSQHSTPGHPGLAAGNSFSV